MRIEPVDAGDPREMLRRLRRAVHGAGTAIDLGGAPGAVTEVPAGTALVLTTSGSTGVPKGVVLSRAALTASAMATAARIGEGAWLLALPAGYIAGVQVLVRSIVSGRQPAVLSGRFRPQAFAAAAAGMASSVGGQRIPSYTALVPAQLSTLLDAAPHDTAVASSLRAFEAILVGGQALSADLAQRAVEAGARIVRTYGSTETAGGCVYDGVPLDGVRVEESQGELRIAGPVLAEGYLGDQEQTRQRFVADAEGTRWYRTGDLGGVELGRVQVTGRADNVIVSGGVNVSLDRVEEVVRRLPGLADAVVVAIPDARWGQGSAVVARGQDDGGETARQVREAVGDALGAPARPSRILWTDTIPQLLSGKPDRGALRRRVGDILAEEA